MKRLLYISVLVACGGGGSSTPDAPPDAAPIEIDAPMDGLATHRYVVSVLKVPSTNNQAREFGLDLNGDLTVDNQLGMVMGTLAGQGFQIQAQTTTSVDRGEILMLPELRADALTASTLPATFTIFKGANPSPPACAGTTDTTCRKHLTGTAFFQIAPDSPNDTPLTGTIVNSTLTAGPGHLTLVTHLMGAMPIALDLIGARVKLTMLADGTIGGGNIGGGVKQTDLDTKVYPQMQMGLMASVMKDCPTPTAPDCGCAPNTTGKTSLNLFDTMPKNCAITVDEVKNNTLIQSLFAPDVTLEGQPCVSIGVSITAVGAKYTK